MTAGGRFRAASAERPGLSGVPSDRAAGGLLSALGGSCLDGAREAPWEPQEERAGRRPLRSCRPSCRGPSRPTARKEVACRPHPSSGGAPPPVRSHHTRLHAGVPCTGLVLLLPRAAWDLHVCGLLPVSFILGCQGRARPPFSSRALHLLSRSRPHPAPRARGGAVGQARPDCVSWLSLKGVCRRVDRSCCRESLRRAAAAAAPSGRVPTTLPSSSGHPWASSGLQGALGTGLPCPSREGALAISLGDGTCGAPAGCGPARPR